MKYLHPNSIPIADLPGHYDVDSSIHNLENGYWSVMPRIVARAFDQHNGLINRLNVMWARDILSDGNTLAASRLAAQRAIARQVGCLPEEIAITGSGSASLQALIANYRHLKSGDAVICCDLDYDSAIVALELLAAHRGVQLVKFAMPEPATTANILGAYEERLRSTPNAKLLLLTQVSHRTGLVTPVREIVAMARAMGIDTIVDAAHGIACLDYQLDDLGADFVCWSVHKWTSAPLGTGAFYIRKSRLADIAVAFENRAMPTGDIVSRAPAGATNFAAMMTIPTAVDFHFAVGAAQKEQHLRGLRNRWVDAVRDLPNVEICVPDDAARYCAITSFRLKGMDSDAQAQQLQKLLFDKYRINVVSRTGVAAGPVIRVTPGLYTTDVNVDALALALRAEHGMFT